MKTITTVLSFILTLFSYNASALHGNPFYGGTIDYCDPVLCDLIDSIDSGTTISASLFFELDISFPILGDLVDYNISIDGLTDSVVLDTTNTSILINTVSAYANENEDTFIEGGILSLDTTLVFAGDLGFGATPELIFDFDKDRIDFFILDTLAATTKPSPVPVPGALFLFLSGIVTLLSFSGKRRRT